MSNREAGRATQLSPAAQETESAAERLTTQIGDALCAVANQTTDDSELEASADRIERAARDLSVALRELARRRRNSADES
ncbi:MAG: hypothetical protein LC785_02955 [Acidobacteria bacterium]|nr:hypothetical protein [Acidobacteriota bacterium]MCA1640944.1 hypothetical protein [Acidobacteriota bacterium]